MSGWEDSPRLAKPSSQCTDGYYQELEKETNMFKLFDLILVFLERVFGLSWGEWDADDRPDLLPSE